ncbi:MAG: hypothetical protein GX783_04445 [Clostridiales bacterium]|nr:hypothetical protein [Clostridiales bacterium]
MINYQGKDKKHSYFEGWYFKHTKEEELLAFIPGVHIDDVGNKKAFIQVISGEESFNINYDFKDTYISEDCLFIRIGGNEFSKQGLKININTISTTGQPVKCHGKLHYTHLTPPESDIMGPFRFIPFMECNHGIISMRHKVIGSITLNGKEYTFHDHMGYIEKDWGSSFPEKYFWLQCNDFETEKASIMIAIAEIPFFGLKFTGCICSVYLRGREYRLATYHKVKIKKLTKSEIVLKQGDYLLEINMEPSFEHNLMAPDKGKMSRMIKEAILGTAGFRFQIKNKTVFQGTSKNVSYEWVEYDDEHIPAKKKSSTEELK